MKKTQTVLADGRELIYFDERDDAVRATVDRRHLPPREPAAELRLDPLLDEWVAIATHRQGRIHLPPSAECPLCPSTAERLTEVPADAYDVVVFENRFPAFRERGRCEVVGFTSDHDASFATLAPDRVATIMAALADRTAELSALPDVEQVFCFENRGEEIGVTISHPHGQIYAYPFVPPRTATMLAVARRYADRTGRVLASDVLAAERADGERVVVGNEHWTAYVPAAAHWPFEVHVVPHRQMRDLRDLTDFEVAAFAEVYLDLLPRLDRLFDAPLPYIAAWHQAPLRHPDRELAYLHLQLTSVRRAADKLKHPAGSETAMGVFVNDVRPEEAAAMLRAARPTA